MGSDWLRRYHAGEHEQVWTEISALGVHIRADQDATKTAERVAQELMSRVARNAARLEHRLRESGFEFLSDKPGHWPDHVITPPRADVLDEIDAVEKAIGGPLPISVRAFITHVGGLDFNGRLPGWEARYVDALQVLTETDGLGVLLIDMIEEGMLDGEPGGRGKAHLELAADYLHKADISGGLAYGVFVPDGAADAAWRFDTLHPSHTFVGYLRAVFADGGLPGWRRTPGEQPPPNLARLVQGLERF